MLIDVLFGRILTSGNLTMQVFTDQDDIYEK